MHSRTFRLVLTAIPLLLLAHAVAFFMHEYAHSVSAWVMHGKTNPLALHYGPSTIANILLQQDIDENVDYGPIFADGRDGVAALIAVAGVLFGNGLSYVLSRVLYVRAKRQNGSATAQFAFWLCLMSVGNFLSYVPLRTFSTHADMHTVEIGLHVSPWVISLGLGIPFGAALLHFLLRILPDAEGFLLGDEYSGRCLLVILSCSVIFEFFGRAGLHGYGEAAHRMSAVCVYAMFPVAVLLCWPRRGGYASTRP
jgi:hypothetical protein